MSSDHTVLSLSRRPCKLGRSFRVLGISKFNADSIISISSIPEYNEEAGINRVVHKDYTHLDDFAKQVVDQIEEILEN